VGGAVPSADPPAGRGATGPVVHDVAVVGAGVVGTAIARRLARYRLRCVLVEAGPDVGAGTSKANTAILHTGFDAKPGTREAALVRRGRELLLEEGPGLGIPIEQTGALLVAWTEGEVAALPGIADRARENGWPDVLPVDRAELYRREPHLGPGALAGLEIPGEGIVCPWTPPLAFATEAVAGGVELRLASPVGAVRRVPLAEPERWVHELDAGGQAVRARWVVNAAGLASDEVDRMFGHDGFTVTPRRGELIVFDKLARPLLRRVLLPVPTATTKGVLVAPTVFGNVLLGPTAEDLDDKRDTATSARGLAGLLAHGGRILPELVDEEVTAVYAGLRAATEHGDYQLAVHPDERYACAGGIRSTGLTASLAIAEHLVGELGRAGLPLVPAATVERVRLPNLGEAFPRPYRSAAAIAANPDHGRIVCHCERVTRGELLGAMASPIPPSDLDGLRRRTRVLLGRCQGFYCAANVAALLAEATGRPVAELLGTGKPAEPRSVSVKPRRRPPSISVKPRRRPPSVSMDLDVLVVGGGPAGLAAAEALRHGGAGRVLVVDREEQVGGVPRHTDHPGFGLRDLRRVLTGPAYARAWAARAAAAGAELWAPATATGWTGPRALELTAPDGRYTVKARAVLLATGCRERPRSARLVPGTRPLGVLTTGTLQQLIHLHGERVGGRAVVVGAEHVSFSAVLTLVRAGAEVAAVITEEPRHQTFVPIRAGAGLGRRVPVLTSTRLGAVLGRPRVEAVELTDLRTGSTRVVPCDLVVFTGDWIPDHELARRGRVAMDPGTRGPRVDQALRTSEPGVFAAGNLLHGAEAADAAALEGRHAAGAVLGYLATGDWPDRAVDLVCAPPLRWLAPSRLTDPRDRPPLGRLLLRSGGFRAARLEVRQDGSLLWSGRRHLVPNRSAHLPAGWLARVDPAGGPVTVALAGAD
jgi:L-2-hydroxyglutarate oxidase LhgO